MRQREKIIEHIMRDKVIAILRNLPREQLFPIAEALVEGGISLIEVPMANRAEKETAEAVAALKKRFGEKVSVGAGTVTGKKRLEMAVSAGAEYIISPDTDAVVIRQTKEAGLVSIPGAYTPTEILYAWNAGADFVKIFPASSAGSAYIKAVRVPCPEVPLLAVGGIDAANMGEYLAAGVVGIGIGSKLFDPIRKGEDGYEQITVLAEKIQNIAQNAAGIA